jgi:hypothetical protein
MGNIGKTLAPAGNLTLAFAENMLKAVKPETFARLATGQGGTAVQSNHPAWVYGHLACYVARSLELLGHPDAARFKNPAFEELFKNGTQCRDDPTGTIYPSMEVVTKAYFDGYRTVLAALPETSDDVLLKANPAEGRMKELFPTVGSMMSFLIAAHPMSHLGQVSAWRRFMGLGSAT